ncbi:MAG: O-antigen ligase family protein [Deltaproteobacteria bacterium]
MNLLPQVLNKLILALILSLLVVSPILYGSVEALPKVMLELVAYLLFALWLVWLMITGQKLDLKASTIAPLLGLIAVGLIQILPLPDFILGVLSGESLAIWRENQSELAKVGFTPAPRFFTISLYPHGTWNEIVLLTSYIVFGIVVSKRLNTRASASAVLIAVAAVAFYEAIYGIYGFMTNTQTVPQASLVGVVSATGTFVNRNHFAGFLEMCIPLMLGYVFYMGNWSARDLTLKKLVASENFQKQIVLASLVGVMLLALLFSKSRVGIVACAMALGFFYLSFSGYKRSVPGRGLLPVFFLVVLLLFGFWVGFYSIFERFLRVEADSPGRLLVWKDSLAAIGDFPAFGTGLGTFGYVYPLYKNAMDKAVVYSQAHNDYLQLLFESGIVGFICAALALGVYLAFCLRALRRLSSDNNPAFFLLLGSLSGVMSLLIHSLADFNLHIPSNALYFAFLIGFSAAASNLASPRITKANRESNPAQRAAARVEQDDNPQYLM